MAERNESRSSRDRDEPRRGRDEDRGSSRRSSRDDEDRGSRRSVTREEAEPRRGRDEGRGSSGRGSSSGFEYHGRSDEGTRKRAEQGANDFDKILLDGIQMFKPHDKDNRIRIVPPTWAKPKHYGLDIYVHYGVGPDRGTYLDLTKMKGEADPISEEQAAALKDGDDDYAKEISAKHRVLVYLIDRDDEKAGVQAWAMPSGLDRDIVKVSIDKQSGEILQIDHPEEGYDLTFEKNGTGITTKYEGVAIARRSSPLGKSEWLDYAVDKPLPDQLQYYDYDHIAKVFAGKGAHKEKSRDADRDEPRGGRGRDRDDDRGSNRREIADDDRPDRGRDSGSSSRGSRSQDSDTPTWDSVHAMSGDELEDLIDQEKLDINPDEAKSDDDLADWICEEMKIKKVEARRRAEPDDDDRPSDRLRRMRQERD